MKKILDNIKHLAVKYKNVLIILIVIFLIVSISLYASHAFFTSSATTNLIKGTTGVFEAPDFNIKYMVEDINEEGVGLGTYTPFWNAPEKDYTFNEEKSECVNGGTFTRDAETETFTITAPGKTRCEFYYDVNTLDAGTDIKITILKENLKEDGYEDASHYTIEGLVNASYKFNESASSCVDGSSITFDSATNKLKVSAESPTECTVKFDKITPFNELILENNGGKDVIEAKADPDFTTVADTAEETGMWSMPDDYGISYYFRGAVDNNWVHFAGYYWRIIRINGDGSVRVIYSGVDQPLESEKVTMLTDVKTEIDTGEAFNSLYNDNAYVGYMYTVGERQGLSTSSPMKALLENWYTTNLTSYDNLIADNLFCYDRSLATSGYQSSYYGSANGSYTGTGTGTSPTLYGVAERVTASSSTFGPGGSAPEFTCPSKADAYTVEDAEKGNGAIDKKIGLLSVDEVVASKLVPGIANHTSYLYTNSSYWLGSPFGFNSNNGHTSVWNVGISGDLSASIVNYQHAGVRPVVSISNLASVSGSGEWNDPYVVE